jgi:hypothetical protein
MSGGHMPAAPIALNTFNPMAIRWQSDGNPTTTRRQQDGGA